MERPKSCMVMIDHDLSISSVLVHIHPPLPCTPASLSLIKESFSKRDCILEFEYMFERRIAGREIVH